MKNHHISNWVTCWRMQLSNGKLLCFTDADQDIDFAQDYYIAGSYFTPNQVKSSNELAQDNFIISGIIDNNLIQRDALLSGEFLDGYVEVFLVNLADSPQARTILKTGWIGEIKCSKNSFTAEICSLSSKTNNIIGRCYSNFCRAEFADQYCKLNRDKYSIESEVCILTEENSFIDDKLTEPDDYFSKGILTFLSGKHQNRKYHVSEFRNNKISLDSTLKLSIQVGDKYNIIAGCDKSLHTCINKFNNALNFRGEPYIPSKHQLCS